MSLSPRDARRLDANAAFLGMPTAHLMEAAGAAVAQTAHAMLKGRPGRVLVLAGLGNNGGDGFVAAGHLSARHEVTLLIAGDEADLKTEAAVAAFTHLDPSRVRVEAAPTAARLKEHLAAADLVIDALLGVGLSGRLRGPVRGLVRGLNAAKARVLSVDAPTGLGTDLAVRPEATVTFHAKKLGMTRTNSGRIVVADLGIPPEAETRCGPGDLLAAWRPNRPEGRKGDHGRLLIVAGGPYGGAPVLASLAALRTGVDLVRLASTRPVAAIAQGRLPDLVTHPGRHEAHWTPDDAAALEPVLGKVDAVLAGPGLGTAPATRRAVVHLLAATQRHRLPLVLDADALPVAAQHPQLLKGRPVLMTPHAGELRAMMGRALPRQAEAAWTALEARSKAWGATVLLKGAVDRIADGRVRRENVVHHPVMTRGGTGDVLAGCAAALVARGAPPTDAACAAAFLVGATALRLVGSEGHGLLASQIAWHLGRELERWLRT